MGFSLREFIKKGLLDAVGKMADYQIILNATGWYEKQVLTMEDLAEMTEDPKIKNTLMKIALREKEHYTSLKELVEK